MADDTDLLGRKFSQICDSVPEQMMIMKSGVEPAGVVDQESVETAPPDSTRLDEGDRGQGQVPSPGAVEASHLHTNLGIRFEESKFSHLRLIITENYLEVEMIRVELNNQKVTAMVKVSVVHGFPVSLKCVCPPGPWPLPGSLPHSIGK